MGAERTEAALAETYPAGEAERLSISALAPALDQTCDMGAESIPSSPSSSQARVAPGVMMMHFRVEEALGAGGMGQVYRARDVSLERDVALKVISEELGDRPALIERFVREARAQAKLNHPHIVSIYYIGRGHGRYFFAMELVEGESLLARLERAGPLGWCEAVEWMIQAARGLQQATARGIIHRDIKPANLLVTRDGRLKIADFGLAWSGERDPGQQEGSFLGTPLYVAPEQARGEPVDHRADMYALGATFFHLLTGRPPFVGSSHAEVIRRVNEEPAPDLRGLTGKAPRGLRQVIDRLLSKAPGERYERYDDLIAALEKARPRQETPAGFWVRAVAVAMDALVAALVAAPLQWWLPQEVLVFLVVAGVYLWVALSWQGMTLGMWVLRLRVTTEDDARPSWRRALVRLVLQFWGPVGVALVWLGMTSGLGVTRLVVDTARLDAIPVVHMGVAAVEAVILVSYVIGILMIALHPRKRALHDLWSRTRVVYWLAEDERQRAP
jgi:uncharacterized RDD family membrane protein YckC